MNKDLVTNLSTALMAVKDMATYNDIPIEIHFENHYIHIFVGYGTPYQKYIRIYPQDCYRMYSKTDEMRKWIEDAIEEIQKEKSKYMVEIGEKIHEGVEEALEEGKKIDWKKANPNFYPDDHQFGTVDAYIAKMREDGTFADVWPVPDSNIANGYPADWTPPELEKLGIPYPATQEDIVRATKVENLIDASRPGDEAPRYILGIGVSESDLTPYERHLLEKSEAYWDKKKKE